MLKWKLKNIIPIQNSSHEINPREVRRTVLKVVIGFGAIAVLFFLAVNITQKKLSSLSATIEGILEPNIKLVKLKEISGCLYGAEANVRAFTIRQDTAYLLSYENYINYLNTRLDTLRVLSKRNSEFSVQIDTLKKLIDERIELFSEYIELKTADESGDVLEEGFKKIESEMSDGKNKSDDKNKPRKIFLFSKKQLKEEQAAAKKNILKIIQRTKEEQKIIANKKLSDEIDVTKRESIAMNNIFSLLNNLEQKELVEGIRRIHQATRETTGQITFISNWLIGFGIVLAMVFSCFIYMDVQRAKRFKEVLLLAKTNTEKLAKAKEDFLANISHEIRTPMNVILGFAEQMHKTELDNKQSQLLNGIRRSSSHLLMLINEILDYSKMESGKLEFETIGFRASEVANDVLLSLKNSADRKNISFTFSVSEEVPDVLLGDPIRLKQILLNLASNAIKFTANGSVEIIIEASTTSDNGNGTTAHLSVKVKDTGVGIPQTKIKNIFEAFSQADNSITRKFGGTGLGLAISKKLVELQNGVIGAESVLGEGSVFYFVIPYKVGVSADIEKEESIESFDDSILQNKTVLVVEDDELNKMLARMILEGWGMKVSLASDGQEAIACMEKENFDVVLMDLQMPGLSGIDVVKHMRNEMKGANANVPVIALTGNALKGEEEKCISCGMNDYITKPFKEKTLYQKLKKAFNMN